MTSSAASAGQRAGPLGAMRDAHRRKVLELLLAEPAGLTQEELRERAGLARSSISTLLRDLGRAVEKRADTSRGDGRPPQVHMVDPGRGVLAGVDIGLTRIYLMLADLAGTPLHAEPIVHRFERIKPPDAPGRTLAAAARGIEKLLGEHGRTLAELAAVGVTLPGAVKRGATTMADPGMRAWHPVDVPARLAKQLGIEVRVAIENDGNAAMLAEHRWGKARNVSDALFVDWSSGVGSGMLIGKSIFHGASGVAAEVGHVQLPLSPADQAALQVSDEADAQQACPRCGRLLCIDRVIGGVRIQDVLGVEDVPQAIALAHTDPQALALFDAAARLLGRAVGVCATLLDPELVILGGFVGQDSLPFLKGPLRKGIEETVFLQRAGALTVETSELAEHASLRGAIAVALDAGSVTYLSKLA